jgi:hypothetical protein
VIKIRQNPKKATETERRNRWEKQRKRASDLVEIRNDEDIMVADVMCAGRQMIART